MEEITNNIHNPKRKPVRMYLLDYSASYELLQHKVFQHEECPSELEGLLFSVANNPLRDTGNVTIKVHSLFLLRSLTKSKQSPLQNLETLSAVMIEMITNVTKLVIYYFGVERATHSIENIELLSRLEKLKVWVMVPFSSPQNLNLGIPTTLIDEVNLKRHSALSPRYEDFEGNEWIVRTSRIFRMLEYLLLQGSGLRKWWCRSVDDGSVFPKLKTVVIRGCNELNSINVTLHSIT